MTLFLQLLTDGVATGAVYALLALALVFVHQTTGVANLAQGEMATFAAFAVWSLATSGLSPWLAVAVVVAVSVPVGMALEVLLIRRLAGRPLLVPVIMTLGLFLVFNRGATFVWGAQLRDFPQLLPGGVVELGGVRIAVSSLLTVVVVVAAAGATYLLVQRTRLGLAMRATTANRESSALVGIRTGRMLSVGWGIATALGSLAGVLTAAELFLEPNMMLAPLLFAFAAATLGGLDSPIGAVVGGVLVGVVENLAGTYVPFVGSDLKVAVPLVAIVLVLLFRPRGLFGRAEVVRA